MKDLIKELLKGNCRMSDKDSFDRTTVYAVEAEGKKVLFWNSNNSKSPDREYVMKEIATALLDGETEGSIYEPFIMVEIMWEVKNA